MNKDELRKEVEKVSDSFLKKSFMDSGSIDPLLVIVVTNKQGKRGLALAPMPYGFTESYETKHKFMFIVGQSVLQNAK